MAGYASGTKVSIARSRAEVEEIMHRYDVEAYATLRRGVSFSIQFERGGRAFQLPVEQTGDQKEDRRRWRVLILWLKGLCEMIDSDVVSFETAFAMWLLLPDGSTLAQKITPRIDAIATRGELPRLKG